MPVVRGVGSGGEAATVDAMGGVVSKPEGRGVTTCTHPDAYTLGAFPVIVWFCRNEDCQQWELDDGRHVRHGQGLTAYQQAVCDHARELPQWKGAAFLYDLGGHAPEVSNA